MRRRGSSTTGGFWEGKSTPWRAFSTKTKKRKKKQGHSNTRPPNTAPNTAAVRSAACDSLRGVDAAGQIRKVDVPRPPEEYTRYVEFDMRPGGSNRMEIRTADGHLYLLRVTFREIVPPEKLVFTWAWERFSASGQKD